MGSSTPSMTVDCLKKEVKETKGHCHQD